MSGRLLLALALVGCDPPPPPPPDLLLITLDTTRADALGAYSQAEPSPTPTIDRLAASGLRVDEAVSVAPLTLPSHSSLLTGLYPDRHGVRSNDGHRLDDDVVTLAERLRDAGYNTAAFVSAVVLSSSFGIDQGFSTYNDSFAQPAAGSSRALAQRNAGATTDQANAWFANTLSDPRPFFAWVHYFDPHQPLAAPSEFAQAWEDPYTAEVAYVDQQVSLILENLRIFNRAENLLIVVAGDHGESRGEHGEATHGYFVYRATARVPLILHGPGVPAGEVMPGPVSQVDVVPTVLNLLGLPVPDGLDGADLWRREATTRPVFGESFTPRLNFGVSELRFVQDATHRYILSPRPELYAWREDPQELNNLVAVDTGAARALDALVRGRIDAVASADAVPPELLTQLQALGYIGGVSLVDPEAPFDTLGDPKDHLGLVDQVNALVAAVSLRPPERILPALREFTQLHPAAAVGWSLLCESELRAGTPEGALAALAPLLAARPEDAGLLTRQGEILAFAGRDREAVEVLRRALALQPRYAVPYALLAEIARRQGQLEQALALAEQGLALDEGALRLILVRGATLLDLGRAAEAVGDLQAVLDADPSNLDVRYLLGMSLARSGRVDEALPLFAAQLQYTPDAPRLLAAVGLALHASGARSEAIPYLERAIGFPDLVGSEPMLVLADCLLREGGDLERIEALLDQVEVVSPGDQQVHALRAIVRVEQRRFVDAAESLRQIAP